MKFVIRIVLACMLTWMLAACAGQTPPADSFRVLTYNVNFGGDDSGSTLAAIKAASADIICLQETTPEWETVLDAAMGKQFPYREFRQSKGRLAGGLGILSKYPIKEIAYLPSETTWFDGWVVQVEMPTGAVQIVNVHLQPPVLDNGHFSLSTISGTERRRQAELERVLAKTTDKTPLIVAGDFNDDERSSVVESLVKRGMTSALGQFNPFSMTWFYPPIPIVQRRMDHIVYRGLKCYQAYVTKAGASDHYPVVAVLSPIRKPE